MRTPLPAARTKPSIARHSYCREARVPALERPPASILNWICYSSGFPGGVPKWPTGAVCKIAGAAFGGSNPPPTTDKAQVRLISSWTG